MPWGRPRHELVLLALCAVVALLPVYPYGPQDQSRICLAQALLHGHVSSTACLASSYDKSSYGGHLYSDKAPGTSVLELPSVAALNIPPGQRVGPHDAGVWGVRLLTCGLAFLLGALLVGRLAEGLAPGRGALALVAFALGTLVAPLAATSFSHVISATIGFAAFLAAWRRRFLAAGLLAGAAVFVEYQTAAILVLVGLYVALRGVRPLAAYAAGVLPAAGLLLAYDAVAFGSPFHLSYRYVVGDYVSEQSSGFFGIGLPNLHATHDVFVGPRGLLVISPVLVAAAYGLVLLWRRYRAETLVCAAVAIFFVILDCGYFLPYGGGSPGPRFLVPALPFLAVGLGPAFARRPRVTAALAAASIIATVGTTLVWSYPYPTGQTIWTELGHVATEGRSALLVRVLTTKTALAWIGIDVGGIVIAGAAVAAVLLSVTTLVRRPRGWRALAVAVVALALLAGTVRAALLPLGLRTTIAASTVFALPGDEVDLHVTVANRSGSGFDGVRLVMRLPPGVLLLGAPVVERGPGCGGTTNITCSLQYLDPHTSTVVSLGLRVLADAPPSLRLVAWSSTGAVVGPHAGVVITTGSG
ncbi:MAG TPA: hypothetical protein VGL76_08395 [Gaiellaceae bacterium]